MEKTNFKFKVNIIESERGWGQKIDEVEEYDTYEEAAERIKSFNSKNTDSVVPDWYMRAEPANFKINPTK